MNNITTPTALAEQYEFPGELWEHVVTFVKDKCDMCYDCVHKGQENYCVYFKEILEDNKVQVKKLGLDIEQEIRHSNSLNKLI